MIIKHLYIFYFNHHSFAGEFLGFNESGIAVCPEGYYCPNGTGRNLKKCPPGTYSNTNRLKRELDCIPCDAGKYCNDSGLTVPTGDCDAGYFCVQGVHTATPEMTNLTHCPLHFAHMSVGGKCPAGFYCPKGSKTYTGKTVFW